MADKKVNPRRKHRDNQTEVEVERRRLLVIANLLAGATYREIAAALNIAPATVTRDRKAILNEWKEHYGDDYGRLVAQQSRRYDMLLNSLWAKAVDGDLAAIDRVLKILDRIDRILGVPEHMDVTSDGKTVSFEIKAIDYRSAIGPLAPLN
jgi:AcrR family transcriptional regulator